MAKRTEPEVHEIDPLGAHLRRGIGGGGGGRGGAARAGAAKGAVKGAVKGAAKGAAKTARTARGIIAGAAARGQAALNEPVKPRMGGGYDARTPAGNRVRVRTKAEAMQASGMSPSQIKKTPASAIPAHPPRAPTTQERTQGRAALGLAGAGLVGAATGGGMMTRPNDTAPQAMDRRRAVPSVASRAVTSLSRRGEQSRAVSRAGPVIAPATRSPAISRAGPVIEPATRSPPGRANGASAALANMTAPLRAKTSASPGSASIASARRAEGRDVTGGGIGSPLSRTAASPLSSPAAKPLFGDGGGAPAPKRSQVATPVPRAKPKVEKAEAPAKSAKSGFNAAFAAARKAGKKTFVHNGKKYSTRKA